MEDVLEIYQALHDSLGEGDIGTAFCQRLRQTIQELIDSLPPDFKIGIRPMAPETEKLLEEFDFSKKNVDGVYDRQRRRETFCGYPCFSTQDFQPEEKRIFLIVSYYHHQEIKEELEKSGIRFWICMMRWRGKVSVWGPILYVSAGMAYGLELLLFEVLRKQNRSRCRWQSSSRVSSSGGGV